MKAPHLLDQEATAKQLLDTFFAAEKHLSFEPPPPIFIFDPVNKTASKKMTMIPFKCSGYTNKTGDVELSTLELSTLEALPDLKAMKAAYMQEFGMHSDEGWPPREERPAEAPGDPKPWTDRERFGSRLGMFQGAYDRMLLGMRKQRCKGSTAAGACMFSAPLGKRCIVGMLIPERAYSLHLEGNVSMAVVRATGLPDTSEVRCFLEDARINMHDALPNEDFMPRFEVAARFFADRHGLHYRYPGERVAHLPEATYMPAPSANSAPCAMVDHAAEYTQF